MRTMGWLLVVLLEITACTQVAGLDADYTSSSDDAGASGSSSSASSSSGELVDAEATSSSGGPDATSSSGDAGGSSSGSSSSGGSLPSECSLAGTGATACARCVLSESDCSEVCGAPDAALYRACLRDAADQDAAEDCLERLPRQGARRDRQRACIDRCAQDERPCR